MLTSVVGQYRHIIKTVRSWINDFETMWSAYEWSLLALKCSRSSIIVDTIIHICTV